ncbi:hypothetical protein ACFX2B_006760 [Malus domestica]
MIWDTFAVDEVIDESACVHPSHLPYLFLRQMWYLFWNHKMLKISTREQCQVRTKAKEKIGKKHDMRYSCSGVAGLHRQALSKEIWLSKFKERYLFGFQTSNLVGDLALEIRRAVPLRFLRKQSCWESGS